MALKAAAKLAEAVPVLLRDAAGLSGIGLISYGAWLVYAPAGYIAAGALLLALALVAR
ncbi:MAG TPA: hypothetical protein VKS25_01595 [Solirubrobacteraceae bacterium]|nr:hypothetical protein [Solirubrobacteraceae bacterium]